MGILLADIIKEYDFTGHGSKPAWGGNSQGSYEDITTLVFDIPEYCDGAEGISADEWKGIVKSQGLKETYPIKFSMKVGAFRDVDDYDDTTYTVLDDGGFMQDLKKVQDEKIASTLRDYFESFTEEEVR